MTAKIKAGVGGGGNNVVRLKDCHDCAGCGNIKQSKLTSSFQSLIPFKKKGCLVEQVFHFFNNNELTF